MENFQESIVFDCNTLPPEILAEIFSKICQKERPALALVCHKWVSASRIARFNYPLRVICSKTKLVNFIRIFGSPYVSKSLPFNCIELHMNVEELKLEFLELCQIRDIFLEHPQVKLHLHTNDTACVLKYLYDNLPMVQEIHWLIYLYRQKLCKHGFLYHWSNIRKISKSTKILIELKGNTSKYLIEILEVMSNAPIKNAIINEIEWFDFTKFKLQWLKNEKHIQVMKSVKTLSSCFPNKPEHFHFINKFGTENLTTLSLTLSDESVMINNMELLCDLKNLQEITFDTGDDVEDDDDVGVVSFTGKILNFPQIKKVVINAGTALIDYQSFGRFLKSCPDLVEVLVQLESNNNTIGLGKTICSSCPNLRELSINSDDDDEIIVLDAIFNNSVVGMELEQSMHNFRQLETFKTNLYVTDLNVLSGLYLESMTNLDICFGTMSTQGARALVTAFPNLKELSLRADNSSVSKRCIRIISQLKQLQEITFDDCDKEDNFSYADILTCHNKELKINIYPDNSDEW